MARAGDLHGLPGPHLAGTDPPPQPRVAVPEVERVRDQLLRSTAAGAAERGELVDGVLGDVRAPVTAGRDTALHQRLVAGRGGVDLGHVGPARGTSTSHSRWRSSASFVTRRAASWLPVHLCV